MDWTREEVLLIINDYFDMLKKELSGQKYVKAHHRRNLLTLLKDRTNGAVEKKHQNISAVLIEMGLPFISGYKPLYKYQQLLKEEVQNYLINHPEFFPLFDQFISFDLKEPLVKNILKAEIIDDKIGSEIREPEVKFSTTTSKQNYFLMELKNSRLGLLGEQFILKFEQQKLINLGRKDLVKKIEHISQTSGDSAGFDILSFTQEGDEKFIEVKTTQLGKHTPFYFTRNELDYSKSNSEQYSLYRVFDFKRKPRFFQLPGSLANSCDSIPTTYMAWASAK